jgi:hypothetical protein
VRIESPELRSLFVRSEHRDIGSVLEAWRAPGVSLLRTASRAILESSTKIVARNTAQKSIALLTHAISIEESAIQTF